MEWGLTIHREPSVHWLEIPKDRSQLRLLHVRIANGFQMHSTRYWDKDRILPYQQRDICGLGRLGNMQEAAVDWDPSRL